MFKLFNLLIFLVFSSGLMSQAFMDRHSTSKSDAWISCERASSPHSARGSGHWILYDLGDTYALSSSKIWNLNTPDYEGAGFQDMVIDFSIDGTTWQEFGQFRLGHGGLSAFYEGEEGPDFGGLIVRYLLLTGVSNHGHSSCYGLGEIKLEGKLSPVTLTQTPTLDVELKIGPNPTSDIVNLMINTLPQEQLNYHLTDIFGRLIKKGEVTQNRTSIDVSQLNSGLYFLSIINPWGIKTKKLEIIH